MKKGNRRPRRPGAAAPPASARSVAFRAIDNHRQTDQFVAQTLDRQLQSAGLSTQERKLATELAYGVVRRQGSLDALLSAHLRQPLADIENSLKTLLHLGAYQLVYLDHIPAHAAVHETVELCRTLGKNRWLKFVNGILRAIERTLTDTFVESPAANALPVSSLATSGYRYRTFTNDWLPNPQSQPVDYLTAAFGFPRWLIARWQKVYDNAALLKLLFWFNATPPVWLRVNPLAMQSVIASSANKVIDTESCREYFTGLLNDAGIASTPGPLAESLQLTDHVRIEDLPGYHQGWFSVQDLTAMQATDWLSPQPNERVLDMCAAPGTKTSHLAQRLQHTGDLLATDIQPDRLQRIAENVARLGLQNVRVQLIHQDGSDLPPGPFDAVLVDVPCSNTGVLGRRPEARWRLRPTDIQELVQQQSQLLNDACNRTRDGGRVLYSTCSIEPEENSELVHSILASRTDMQLIRERLHIPGQPADGGYLALLEKKDSANH